MLIEFSKHEKHFTKSYNYSDYFNGDEVCDRTRKVGLLTDMMTPSKIIDGKWMVDKGRERKDGLCDIGENRREREGIRWKGQYIVLKGQWHSHGKRGKSP